MTDLSHPTGWQPIATPIPQLPAWCFQPDADTPALYLLCETGEQRAAIMRLLGAPDPLPAPPEVTPAPDGWNTLENRR